MERTSSIRLAVISFIFSLVFLNVSGQLTNSWTGTTSVNWGTPTNWSLGTVPIATDLVVIPNNASGTNDNPTINVAAVCASLTFEAGGQSITLTISGTNSLTVTNAVTINAPTTDSRNKILAVGTGSLTCASVSMANSTSDTRDCRATISSGTATVTGNISMGGTAARNQFTISGAGTLNIGGSISGGDFTAAAGSTVNYNGTVVQIVRPATYSTLKCNNSQSGLFTEAAITATTLTIGDQTENSFFEIRWALTCTGTLNLVSGYFKLGYLSTPISMPAFTTYNISPGTIIEYGATAAQTVSAAPPYSNLKISGASTKTLANNLTIHGDIHIESGSLDLLAYTANRSTYGGALIISDGATLLVKGSSNYPANYETHSLGLTSTVNYALAGAQNVAVDSYGNLTLSGGNTKSFAGATEIRGTLSIASGTLANLGTSPANSGSMILNLGGTNQVAGTYGSTASAATYKLPAYFGTTATAILDVQDAIVWLGTTNSDWSTGTNWSGGNAPNATKNVLINDAGNDPVISSSVACRNISIAGGASLTINGSNSLTVYGNWSKPDGVPFNAGTSSVIFAGSSDVVIGGWTVFYNLVIDKATGTAKVIDLNDAWPLTSFEVTNDLTITSGILEMHGTDWDYFIGNDITIESNGTLNSNHWFPLHVKGNWTNNSGTYVPGGCFVVFDGEGSQTITGTGINTFCYLMLTGANTQVTCPGQISVNAGLLLDPGTTMNIQAPGNITVGQ